MALFRSRSSAPFYKGLRSAAVAILVALGVLNAVPASVALVFWAEDKLEAAHYQYMREVVVEITINEYGKGSGIVIGPELVLTAAHVVGEAQVDVKISEDFKGQVLVVDHKRDLALIRVPGLKLDRYAVLASDSPKIGSKVAVVGYAFSVKTLTYGHISAVRDKTDQLQMQHIIHTALTTNGNSGGPVFVISRFGLPEVIGMSNFLMLNCASPWACFPITHMAGGTTAHEIRDFLAEAQNNIPEMSHSSD